MSETRRNIRWLMLPYGWWSSKDGRMIFFNRRYKPIFQIGPGAELSAADPNEWVSYTNQYYFYNDGTPDKEAAAKEAYEAATGLLLDWKAAKAKLRAEWKARGWHIEAVIPPLAS
jgi:hypothetical protein